MSNDKKEQLKALLRKVPDSYEDFVNGAAWEAVHYNVIDKFIDYIEKHPTDNASDLSGALDDLHGRKKWTSDGNGGWKYS